MKKVSTIIVCVIMISLTAICFVCCDSSSSNNYSVSDDYSDSDDTYTPVTIEETTEEGDYIKDEYDAESYITADKLQLELLEDHYLVKASKPLLFLMLPVDIPDITVITLILKPEDLMRKFL